MEEEIVLFKEKAFIPLPSTITDKEKEEIKNTIGRLIVTLGISKMELAFALAKVEYYNLWSEWGFKSFSSYLEEIKIFSVATTRRLAYIARLAMSHGYTLNALSGIDINKLEEIFSLPPGFKAYIPDLLEFAPSANISQLRDTIDEIMSKKKAKRKKKIFLNFSIEQETLDDWEEIKAILQKTADSTQEMSPSTYFKYLCVEFLNSARGKNN